MTDRSVEPARRSAVLDGLGDVLGAMAHPGFDLTSVLQIVVERAVAVSGSDMGTIAVRDGEVFRIATTFALDPDAVRTARAYAYVPERGTIMGRALLERGVVRIEDIAADPEYVLKETQRAGGYHSVLGVPMLRDGEPVGVMSLGRDRVAPYDEADVTLVRVFAEHAAVAIRLADLLTETREALERETAVSDVLKAISRSAFDLDEVLQAVITRATLMCRADFGSILRPDEDTGFYRPVAQEGYVDPAFLEVDGRMPYKPGRDTLIGRTLLELRPVQIADVLADPEYTYSEGQELGGYRTILGIPMLRNGVPIGAFGVWRREVKPFTDREIALLITFADQAVLAIENVRLFQTVERQRTELARFAPQVATLLSSDHGEQLLAGHRREITALFADLRGFTAFAESAEPEELLDVVRQYHELAGAIIVRNGGTVEHFAGDGLMAFFNDPAPVADHQAVGVRTAIELRDGFEALAERWHRRGYELGLGIGVAVGYATLGRIGFEGRYDYGAVGNVCILASRLSDAAPGGEVLVSQRLHSTIEGAFTTEPVDDLTLKGFSRPVPAFRVVGPSG